MALINVYPAELQVNSFFRASPASGHGRGNFRHFEQNILLINKIKG
jgi:hypothetical protein